MNKGIAAVLTAALLLTEPALSISSVYAQSVSEQDNSVQINTVEDLREFAEKCILDSYSVGKVFVLKSDISLSGTDIGLIPNFGGTFDGNGHTISGLNISESTSAAGLFRYIEQSGTVKNLNVSGRVTPSGTAEKCGGIAGVNRGRIVNCSFNGVVMGNERCGGIAGVNENGAMISSCTASGRIQADHFTGGIAGENFGHIHYCENESSVNTNVTDESLELSDLNVDDLYSTESFSDVTDAGGIAGYSYGSVQNCKNRGAVGYLHIGYNIGGIIGRQEGYISGCENYGVINGRKDIGGIVGQAEPHFMISYSRSRADELKESLEELNGLIDKTINDMERRSDMISGSFSGINSSLDSIREKSDLMMSEAERIVNTDIDSVNELSSRISDCLDMLSPVTDSISDSAAGLAEAFDELSEAGELLVDSLGSLDEGTEVIFDSLDDLESAITELQNASSAVGNALESLSSGLGDPQKMKDALDALESDIYAVKFAVNSISRNASDLMSAIDRLEYSPEIRAAKDHIESALRSLSSDCAELSRDLDRLGAVIRRIGDSMSELAGESDPESGIDGIFNDDYQKYLDKIRDMLDDGTLRELAESAAAVFDSMADMVEDISELSSGISELVNSRALERFGRDISSISDRIQSDTDHISDITDGSVTSPDINIDDLYAVLDHLKSAADSLTASGDHAKSAIDMVKGAWDHLDEASANAVAAAYCASDASDRMSEAADSLGDAVDEAGSIIDFFAEKPDITFVGADDGFIESRAELTSALDSLTRELDRLNGSASGTSDIFAEDMRAINDKCAEIGDIIFDMIDELRDASLDMEEYTEDISESDVRGYADGKISSCVNFGEISGDLNIGGIVGTMGVDNSFDPESDTAETIGERSVNFMYMLRTVVRDSNNYGIVTAKKDAAGGIVGEMSTGCVIGCGGFGDVSSSSGGYVGGVAGNSKAKIVNSSAMCRISGGNYVGGIAGSGTDISGCRGFAEITESGEFSGAIAGQSGGELTGNVFVENGDGGVDGVSYRGKAFPVTYEKMLSLSGVPEEFGVMKLIFTADGEIVDILEYPYGGSVNAADIPEIPAKRGCFAEWEEFDGSDLRFGKIINAVYSNLITAVASEVCRDDGLPVFIVEGSYGDASVGAARNETAWSVKIPDDGAESHIIRYYAEDSGLDVYVNGERVDSVQDGRYLVFSTNLNDFELTTEKKPFDYVPFLYIGGGAAVPAVVIIIAVSIHKKKNADKKNVKVKS